MEEDYGKRKTFYVLSKIRELTRIAQLKENLRETETRAEKWLELIEQTFNLATYARKAFLMAEGKAGLEPTKIPINKAKTEALTSGFCTLAPAVGLEPTTLRLTAACSTIELRRNLFLI